jgi:hypothetical protein
VELLLGEEPVVADWFLIVLVMVVLVMVVLVPVFDVVP